MDTDQAPARPLQKEYEVRWIMRAWRRAVGLRSIAEHASQRGQQVDRQVDVVIVGGGLVGCSLAIALAETRWTVLLLEASDAALEAPPGFDERNLALSRASLNALQSLDVLPRLARAPAPIRHIHVSREGDFGAVRLAAREQGVDAFGGVVMARDLGLALQARLQAAGVERWSPASVTGVSDDDEGWRVSLQRTGETRQVGTRLLVAADGTQSRLREALGIAVERHDYRQRLFVASLRAPRAAADSAWERFTDRGPVALLPRNDGRLGAVCAVVDAEADAIAALDGPAYLDYLQGRFGYRAGRFTEVGRRVAYPLQMVAAQQIIGRRAVLVGNAAQTLHPVGAQGFNLGLRDALTLGELLQGASDPGSVSMLSDYAARRKPDREGTLRFSDGLARLTASRGPLPHLLRSLGLLAFDRMAGLRAPLVSAAMGFRGHVPRASRGAA